MALEYEVITLTTTPQKIMGNNTSDCSSYSIFVQNQDATYKAYIGSDSSVSTTSFGIILPTQYVGATLDSLGKNMEVWAVANTSSCKVSVLRTVR